MYRLLFACTLSLLVSSTVHAQRAIFHWEDETCEYESLFDSTRISRQQIDNCVQMGLWRQFVGLETPAVFELKDLHGLDSLKLTSDYIDNYNTLTSLDLPSIPFWQDYRDKAIKELIAEYRLCVVAYRAYYNTRALYESPYRDSCIQAYTYALNADTATLFRYWLVFTKQTAARNGYPQRVMQEYETKRHSRDNVAHARIDLITFGWWNCANQYIPRVENRYSDSRVRQELQALFISTKELRCDEP